LPAEFTFFWKQHPQAIDAGAFHNDVVAMSDGDLLIHHELAFLETSESCARLEQAFLKRTRRRLNRIVADEMSLSIDEAIGTYLFNSQILFVQRGDRKQRVVLCPAEVAENPSARRLVEQWRDDGIFDEIHFLDLRQSMHGGGGPACLRLRVPLPEDQVESISPHRRWSERLDGELREVIRRDYPTHVTLDDLARPDFVAQAIRARDRVAKTLSP
jgi:succinylarginine dihydrolase